MKCFDNKMFSYLRSNKGKVVEQPQSFDFEVSHIKGYIPFA